MGKKRASGSFDRFNHARAEKVELENRKTRRDLIPREEIEAEWLRMLSHIKYGFSAMPSRMARELSGLHDPGEIYEIIERDINNVFESIANLGLELETEAELELRELDREALEAEKDEDEAEEKEDAAEPKKKRTRKAKVKNEEASQFVEAKSDYVLPEPEKKKGRKPRGVRHKEDEGED